eukprot:519061-Prorocentrum_minimum.AAC.1
MFPGGRAPPLVSLTGLVERLSAAVCGRACRAPRDGYALKGRNACSKSGEIRFERVGIVATWATSHDEVRRESELECGRYGQ